MTSTVLATVSTVNPAAAAEAPPRRRAWVEQLMGMPVSIHLRGPGTPTEDAEVAVAQAFAHLRKVDAVFSTWRTDSEHLRLRAGTLAAAEAHPWHVEVEALAAEAGRRTDGLFTAILPGADGALGYDPTGLVKGWAIAGAAAYLAAAPAVAYCLNAGGDLQVGLGVATDPGPPWRVGIQDPRTPERIAGVLDLVSGAVATSGNAARGAHVHDPRTGATVVAEGSSTVWGPSALWADVWATAAFVDRDLVRQLLPDRDPDYSLATL